MVIISSGDHGCDSDLVWVAPNRPLRPGRSPTRRPRLLYHRPADPERRGSDRAWELAPGRPRRFDPRSLPLGLTQVAGHTGHKRCLIELDRWATDAARGRAQGGIRTLRWTGQTVVYDLGVVDPVSGAAELILIDGEVRQLPAAEVALLPLAGLR